jgi:predicted nucleic acid-binding protein
VIILDTNTVSEAVKPAPSEVVLGWIALQDASSLFITVITQAEILYGIEVLSAGKRKQGLSAATETLFDRHFRGRILSFDQDAARQYATILAARKAAGRPMSQFDAMIAGIARSHGATVATRNSSDFGNCGIRVINPWLA